MSLDRREVLKMIALVTGASLIGGDKLSHLAWAAPPTGDYFTKSEIALLDEVGDTIIPTTDTPGAKATQIGAFMMVMVRDTYTSAEQKVFKTGLDHFKGFMQMSSKERLEFLVNLEKEAKRHNEHKKKTEPDHFYTMIKQLTLFGYFTSEIGATQALRHVKIPGRYDGAYPYKKGDRAFNHDA
jgi:hypothetical protein